MLAAKATGLPVVAAVGVGDPVATGLVQSHSRPGGNVTGVSDVATELSTKRLGLLMELAPGLRRIAMLWNQDDLGMTLRYKSSAEAAERLGVAVQALGVREPDDFNSAFAAMEREMPHAILMVSDRSPSSTASACSSSRSGIACLPSMSCSSSCATVG